MLKRREARERQAPRRALGGVRVSSASRRRSARICDAQRRLVEQAGVTSPSSLQGNVGGKGGGAARTVKDCFIPSTW